MLYFCTIFDKNYLSRGIAMYESLLKVTTQFHLYVFAFDTVTAEVLSKLAWSNCTVIRLTEFENEQLLSVKPTRSVAEYCWTATPSAILYVLEHFGVDHCTYIDADLYFYSDPTVLLEELGRSSVMLTEHRYTKNYDFSSISGIYCVQYNTFRNNTEGLTALHWWNERCIEWCYDRIEDGKFGDQKYLDDWTERFSGVHVLQHMGAAIAPWNVQQYEFKISGSQLYCKHESSNNWLPVVFYHFHYLRFYEHTTIELGDYVLNDEVVRILYYPYIRHLQEIQQRILPIAPSVDIHGNRKFERGIKQLYLRIKRMLYGRYNRYSLQSLLQRIENHE